MGQVISSRLNYAGDRSTEHGPAIKSLGDCFPARVLRRHQALAQARHQALAQARHQALAQARHQALAQARHQALAQARHQGAAGEPASHLPQQVPAEEQPADRAAVPWAWY
jgi:flagellar biosynthesis/type III secretory pathway protein FliH